MRKTLLHQRLLHFDRRLQRQHRLELGTVAGLDEAGRGPLAGPVVASAVIVRRFSFSVRIDDSKKLSLRQRESAFQEILTRADIGIGFAVPEEIDRFGIHQATFRAMNRAVRHLPVFPRFIFVDGRYLPPHCSVPGLPIVDGDAKSLSIACASIVAKVVRDRMMKRLHALFPEFGFDRHKGYGTQEHMGVLQEIGPTPLHRFSFRPVYHEPI